MSRTGPHPLETYIRERLKQKKMLQELITTMLTVIS